MRVGLARIQQARIQFVNHDRDAVLGRQFGDARNLSGRVDHAGRVVRVDLSDHYNFLDSDLDVSGPIVKTVLQSFAVYWNSHLATEPAIDSDPDHEAAQFVVPQAGDAALLERLRSAGQSYRQSHKTHECRDLRFVTDFPNQGQASRNVFNAIVEELGRAKHEAVVESPYFVIKSGGYAVLLNLALDQRYPRSANR